MAAVITLVAALLFVGCEPIPTKDGQPESTLPTYSMQVIGKLSNGQGLYEVEIEDHKYLATSTYGGSLVLCPKVEENVPTND